RLMIVEDHPLVAQGLRALLEDHFVFAEMVQDATLVLAALARVKPALVLLDLSMPEKNGIELLPQIKRALPTVKVLVVTMHLDRALANLAFKVGADGFVPKEATAEELRGAIDAVLRGERFLSSRVPKRAYRGVGVLANPAMDRLTPRQLQILKLMGEGKTGPEVATALGLSPRTIEFHRARMREVLGVPSESGLMRFALALGLAGGRTDLLEDEEEPAAKHK
ncbi:MAG: response regulator, partial [Gemmatimonadales bacterium]